MRLEPSFNPSEFLEGAKSAYEMIVTAFAQGDRKTLKDLLSREVYEGFERAITERERRGETVETTFVSIDKAEIAGAELQGKTAQIVVRFLSKLITATRDASGSVVDGSPEAVADVTDVWTFARSLAAATPTGSSWRPKRGNEACRAGSSRLLFSLDAEHVRRGRIGA